MVNICGVTRTQWPQLTVRKIMHDWMVAGLGTFAHVALTIILMNSIFIIEFEDRLETTFSLGSYTELLTGPNRTLAVISGAYVFTSLKYLK